MNDAEKRQHFKERLQCFLDRACEAEEKKDYFTAGRLFRLALFSEAKLRPDVNNAYGYIYKAMPIY
ncbi:hypothetical protein ACFL3G_02640 [Planctomycetota bacterium]